MTTTHKLLLIIIAATLAGGWWLFRGTPRSSGENVPQASPESAGATRSDRPDGASPATLSFADLFQDRLRREGIAFELVQTRQLAPKIPARFAAERDGPWEKVISKLEERHGLIPFFGANSAWPSNGQVAPSRMVQVGRFLYFGEDPVEIETLKLLADGDTEARVAALDRVADEAAGAESIFLYLQGQDAASEVRAEATRKLQHFSSRRVVDGLVNALADTDDAVQTSARASLVWLGSDDVVRALRVAAKSENEALAVKASQMLEENFAE